MNASSRRFLPLLINALIAPNFLRAIQITRFDDQINPQINTSTDGYDIKSLGLNINGPTVIRVPDWVTDPLGKYYMYFAAHSGKFIRLAYANYSDGPWTVNNTVVDGLRLEDARALADHIASPDILIDDDNEIIHMYCHGPRSDDARGGNDIRGQITIHATSEDGLNFDAQRRALGQSYFRVFKWMEYYFAIDTAGFINRSDRPDRRWKQADRRIVDTNRKMRHAAVYLRGDTLYIFYTRLNDRPERIFVSSIALTHPDDWEEWRATESNCSPILEPEAFYEINEGGQRDGTPLPLRRSNGGEARDEVRGLRDPYVFEDIDGQLYLYYSIRGEFGIAGAKIDNLRYVSV